MFEQKYEKCLRFLSENFQFLEVKFSTYLHRRVFLMWDTCAQRRFRSAYTFVHLIESLLDEFRIAKEAKFLYVDKEDSNQTAHIRGMI